MPLSPLRKTDEFFPSAKRLNGCSGSRLQRWSTSPSTKSFPNLPITSGRTPRWWKPPAGTKTARTLSWNVPSYEAEEFERAGRKTVLFPGIDLVGRVLASGQPAWISNVVNDSNFPRAPIAARVGLHGAFAFPIRVGEATNCVMAFYNR